jgi:NAD+ synthase
MDKELLADRLVSWIREQVLAAGLEGTVFGISGGLDSSVVAVLCHRAFPQSSLGLLMPCHSDPRDERDALSLASKFSIPTEKVVIDGAYDTLLKSLPIAKATVNQVVTGNLKARLRMLTLYFYANQLGYLVAGSGNRSELALGYFTKHGDGSVDILPLGNLVKRQVEELAIFLGIPQLIIDKPPSAGLWPGQTDETELGLSYRELDSYLTTGKATAKTRQQIEHLIASSSHKRNPPPVPNFQ